MFNSQTQFWLGYSCIFTYIRDHANNNSKIVNNTKDNTGNEEISDFTEVCLSEFLHPISEQKFRNLIQG